MPEQIIATLIAGILTVGFGTILQSLLRKQKAIAERSKEEAEHIADAVKTQEEAKKAARLDALMTRLPVGVGAEEFLEKLEQVASKFHVEAQDRQETEDAVESLINSYHGQALSQASVQFWFSVFAATVGFAWIIYAASQVKGQELTQLLNTLPGVAMDAVAFLFFRQASQTRERATQLYDRLRTDKQLSESISVVASIEHPDIRSAAQAQIALQMSGINPAPIDLNVFLGRIGASNALG